MYKKRINPIKSGICAVSPRYTRGTNLRKHLLTRPVNALRIAQAPVNADTLARHELYAQAILGTILMLSREVTGA